MSETKNPEAHLPIDAETRDKSSPVWDMSQERVFIENLLNQRFSFFLVVFSLVLAGAINSKIQLHLQIVLTLGAIVTSLFAAVLGRSQDKLDLILADLFQDPTHPATIIDSRARKGGSRRRLIGVWIPRICSAVLIAGAVLAWLGVLQVPKAGI
jgi:disulfide bond formation protein DsbB